MHGNHMRAYLSERRAWMSPETKKFVGGMAAMTALAAAFVGLYWGYAVAIN